MKKILYFTLFASVLLSCNKYEQSSKSSLLNDTHNLMNTEYNNKVASLATALHQALCENNQLGLKVKEEALKRFDGDVNVLLTDLLPQTIEKQTKSGKEEISIKEYLTLFLPKTKSGESNLLEALQEMNPTLQVAIPVHSEDWDGVSVPKIAFVPENNVESERKPIPAIDENGKWISMSATQEPNEPVIVLSLNERVPVINDSLIIKPTIVTQPSAPTNLTANVYGDVIEMVWDKNNQVTGGYYLYRKSLYDDSFQKIATIKANTASYADFNLVACQYYRYYVTAYNVGKTSSNNSLISYLESDPSNEINVQAPNIPSPFSKLDVFCQGPGVEIRWSMDNYPNSTTVLEWMDPSVSINYSPLVECPASQNQYTYIPSNKGRKHVYKGYRKNGIGNSEPIYDFIYPPYRNAAEISPVYINKITINDVNEVEAWYSGAPEFYIKVFRVDDAGNTIEVMNSLKFAFNKHNNSQSFTNRKVYDWMYDLNYKWADRLTFYVIEGDNDFTMNITAKASVGKKVVGKLDLDVLLAAECHTSFKTSGQDCGQTNLYYFEDPNSSKNMQAYGVTLYFGE